MTFATALANTEGAFVTFQYVCAMACRNWIEKREHIPIKTSMAEEQTASNTEKKADAHSQ